MGIDAIALLHVPFEEVRGAFAVGPSASRLHLVGADGVTFAVDALDDGVLVHTFHAFAADPDEIATLVRGRMGPLLDRHDEPRGVFVFPDVASPKGRTYGAVLDEIGEAGEWVPKVDADHVPERFRDAGVGALESLVAQVTAGIGVDAIADLHRALAGGDAGAFEKAQAEFVEKLSALGNLDELTAQLQQALEGPHEAVTLRPDELAAREDTSPPDAKGEKRRPGA